VVVQLHHSPSQELINMVRVKVDLMGAEPYLYIRPEVMLALKRFFAGSTKERLLYLHGEIDNATRHGFVRNLTIPPQTSEHSSVEIDEEHDGFFDWHDEYTERCKENPVIGIAHSFSGGAHHSSRDENTDALFGEENADRGNEWFFSITATSGKKTGGDFRVDAIFTPLSEAVKEVFFNQLAIEEVGWGYDVDEEFIDAMLKDEDSMVNEKVYTAPAYQKGAAQPPNNYQKKGKGKGKGKKGADKKK